MAAARTYLRHALTLCGRCSDTLLLPSARRPQLIPLPRPELQWWGHGLGRRRRTLARGHIARWVPAGLPRSAIPNRDSNSRRFEWYGCGCRTAVHDAVHGDRRDRATAAAAAAPTADHAGHPARIRVPVYVSSCYGSGVVPGRYGRRQGVRQWCRHHPRPALDLHVRCEPVRASPDPRGEQRQRGVLDTVYRAWQYSSHVRHRRPAGR